MPVLRRIRSALLLCTLLLAACPGPSQLCPEAAITADPEVIPDGVGETNLLVEVSDPNPGIDLDVVTELTAVSGAFGDPFARETTYACAHDVAGPVEICVNATYVGPGDSDAGMPDAGIPDGGTPDGGTPEGGVPEAGISALPQSPDVSASHQYFSKPHIRLSNPLTCSTTTCTTVVCPDRKNECPVVSSITVEPMVPELVPEGGTATITVVAEDPDNGPEALVTTLEATRGTIADPNARETTYSCDPNVGGIVEICVVASDSDTTCTVERCTTVRCPGEPPENTCPIIEDFTASPMTIPTGETMTTVTLDAFDPDEFPDTFMTELTSPTGVFGNRSAAETSFNCGESGPVQLCASASDGDPTCDESRCINVQCPSDIPANVCPMLFVINSIPRIVPEGETTTMVQTRAQDTDGLPFPLELTLRANWGELQNTDNTQLPNNVVTQNATYVCTRPGQVEICVDASDGACMKTQCDIVTCPDDIPIP